ncbi:hypothetical protein BYT27DRAFT_7226720 [Phlegmacium glaucopus]|nr:hypothetical protein BYT27DRAFT_7226720 [Phlegmacium glaucopus]
MTFLHALRRPHLSLRSICRRYASDNASQLASKSSKKPASAGKPPVVALADEEYPEWLWTILQPKVLEDDGPGGKFERAKRRVANRQAIKDRNFMLTQ